MGLILLAALLVELISLAQYRYTRQLMETQLDIRVESELTMKSMRVRGIIKSHEKLLKNKVWDVRRCLNDPDSIYGIINHLVLLNNDVMSSFVAFVPDYYPDRPSLYEPAAYRIDTTIVTSQLTETGHDYTKREFYHQAVEGATATWSDPYIDDLASGKQVTTYAIPVTDDQGRVVAAFGIDLSTKGIIDTLNAHNIHHSFPSSYFLLLTDEGNLISRPDTIHADRSDVDAVVRMINDSTFHREPSSTGHCKVIEFHDKDGSLGYAYYAFMRGNPHWQVVMVCYDDEVYGKLKDVRRHFVLLLLGGVALLGFIMYRFNRNERRLHTSNLQKERADSELRIARNIQAEMLPKHDIMRNDVSVSGRQITALEVGGDLYDYFLRDEKLYFCIGDVSGKGVPSSLVMAVVHSHFRSLGQLESNPARIMQAINKVACEGNNFNMFVTMFIGVLDLPTGRLRYCNAGHDAPLLFINDIQKLAVDANIPVGVFDDHVYKQQEIQLPHDAVMLLYTDGLTEARDAKHGLFGFERTIEAARQSLEHGSIEPVQLMDDMLREVQLFTFAAPQSDDLTMLAVHYHLADDQILLDESITLANDVQQVPQLNAFVKTVINRLNLEPSLVSQLMLAVEEAVVNVMNYAYPIGSHGDVTVVACATRHSIKFIISDDGKAFDPTRAADVDTTLTAEERPIGGLGILLVRELMDSINYERVSGKNILTLTKQIK